MFTVSLLYLFLLVGQAHGAQSILNSTMLERGRGEIGHTKPYGYKRIHGFSRRGNRSQRFEIRHGDCGSARGWSDCKNDRSRIERREAPKNRLTGRSKSVWLGFSIYIPEDFQLLAGGSKTSVIQTKVFKVSMPVWQLFLIDTPRVTFSDNQSCHLGKINDWKGRWNDFTIFADYSTQTKKSYFKLYRNGRLLCDRNKPIINRQVANRRVKIGLKYGIYEVFVSRHLKIAGETPHNLPEKDITARIVKWPFRYDWGVKLPTHILFFDEMLAGRSQEDVDVRMREAAGLRPVD